MRYQVQVLTTGPAARQRAEDAVTNGLIADADVSAAFIQGIADDNQLLQLGALGLTISVLSELADPPDKGGGGIRGVLKRMATPFSLPKARRPIVERSPGGYYHMTLQGLLSAQVRARLEGLGATILERVTDNVWSIRLPGDPRPFARDTAVAKLEALGLAAAPNTRGAAGTATARSTTPATGAAGYEALLQPDADAARVEQVLRSLGAEPIQTRPRVVRFLGTAAQASSAERIAGVAGVMAVGTPHLLHDLARALVGVTGDIGSRPGSLDGAGELVGVADTGLDIAHPDFAGRIADVVALGRPGDASDPHGHGTHVTGTIAGDGSASNGLLAGIAPAARIYFQSLLDVEGGLGGLPADVGELFASAYDAGVRVHNNSWGIFLNARYAGPSLDVDRFVHAHPDFLPVIAGGNDGSCLPGENAGGPGLVDLPSMGVPATAKNALVVGASRSSRTEFGFAELTYGELWPDAFNAPPIGDERVSGDERCLAAFSARGPTDDWRVKPDVVAPGTDIASTRSADAPYRNFWGAYPRNDKYALMGGTSMACPIVAGLAVLTRQYYRREHQHLPSAALLRATIINGADALIGTDATAAPLGNPNFHQGFGRVNLSRTLPTTGDFALRFLDGWNEPGQELGYSGAASSFTIEVTAPGEVRFCLAWTDPPARGLQNALLLTVERPDGELALSNTEAARLFTFQSPHPGGIPGTFFNRDPNNNVHVVRLSAAQPGTYYVTVATMDIASPQTFALVATGPLGEFTREDS